MAAKDKSQKQPGDVEIVKDASATPPNKALALFTTAGALDVSKLKRRNMPRMVLPDTVPIEGAVSGEIIAILNSPTTTVKGKLLHLKHASGEEFCFPVTGAVRQALAPGVKGDDEKSEKELLAILNKEVGKMFIAIRREDGQSKTYKKRMFVFDVFTSDK